MIQTYSIKKIFAVLCFAIFSSTIGIGIITPLLPLYANQLGATGFLMGAIISSFSFSRLAAVPFIGWLSDRRGRKIILIVGLLVFAISSIFYVWAHTVIHLIIIRLFQGMASGIIIPIAQAYVGDLIPKGKEGRLMGYFSASYVTGFGVGPLLGGFLTDYLGMNSAFYAMSFCNMLALLGVLLFVPEITPQKKKDSSRSPFKEIARSKTMWGLFSYRMGISSFRGIFITFLPIYAGIYIGLSASQIGFLMTINAFTMSILQIPCGNIADKYDRRNMVIVGALIGTIAILAIPSLNTFWHLLIVLCFLSIGDAIAMVSASAMVVEEGRYLGMGMVMAMFNMAVYLGQVISPVIGGVLSDILSINFSFYAAGIFMFVGAGLFWPLTHRSYRAGNLQSQ